MPDSLAQLLMQAYGATMPEVRQKQVRQYLHPTEDVLPRTDQRPTDLNQFLDRIFRSQKDYIPQNIELPPSITGQRLKDLQLPLKMDAEAVRGHYGPENRGNMFPDGMPVGRQMGLGGATISLGGTPDQPYLSIFDSWDDPSGQRWMDKSGVPFNVYDRIPIQLDADGTLPPIIPGRGRTTDIRLSDPLADELLKPRRGK